MGKKIAVSDEFLAAKGHTRESYEALTKAGKWSVRNREKHKKMTIEWAEKNPKRRKELTRKSELKRKYGISEEEYEAILESQGGCCAGCGTKTPTGKWGVFAVDHCHDTGVVRGLLCNECNRGIGLLKDDPHLLRILANYLETSRYTGNFAISEGER